MTPLIGKPVLVPVKEVKNGDQLIYLNVLRSVFIDDSGIIWICGRTFRLSELQDMVIEYKVSNVTIGSWSLNTSGIKALPLSISDKEYVLENLLVGKEVSFEIEQRIFRHKDNMNLSAGLHNEAKLIREENNKADDFLNEEEEQDVIDYWVAKKKLYDKQKEKEESWDNIICLPEHKWSMTADVKAFIEYLKANYQPPIKLKGK